MVGLIDIGGGMRDVYGAGVLDYCIENDILFPYCIGVSAGSANIAAYLSRQKGRNIRFYRDYSRRREYMSFHNFFKKGSYVDLDYIYSFLCNEDGEDPLDFDAIQQSGSRFYIVATNAETGEGEYLDFANEKKNNYNSIKASCCIPLACKAYPIDGTEYFDGGVAEPVPFEKAFLDGCDRVVVIITRPVGYTKKHRVPADVYNHLMKSYPSVAPLMDTTIDKYNDGIKCLQELEKEGKALIIAPDSCCGVETLTRNRNAISALYKKGFEDGRKIKEFLCNIR